MLSYEGALSTILNLPFDVGSESIALSAAAGRRLAEAPCAPFDQPRFDNSSMDGFAVRSGDLAAVGPTLPIVGESAAGRRFDGTVPIGGAIRISTGAPVPEELDVIVPVEEVHVDGDRVTFQGSGKPGLYRRRQGSDVAAGAPLLSQGHRLDGASIALLASFNLVSVSVYRQPRVGILTSGNEVRLLGESLGPDDIVGSSIYYLMEELRQCGCNPRFFGVARDDSQDYGERFGAMLEWADILVTTAGVSVGTHDVVGEVIAQFDGHVHFWKVAVRPGKPMLVASYGSKHHFGFPGNPVSTCCNTEIFLKPFLRKAFGMVQPVPTVQTIELGADCPRDHARLFFVYARQDVDAAGRAIVTPLPNQNSGNLSLCAASNALIIAAPGNTPLPRGSAVSVHSIREGL